MGSILGGLKAGAVATSSSRALSRSFNALILLSFKSDVIAALETNVVRAVLVGVPRVVGEYCFSTLLYPGIPFYDFVRTSSSPSSSPSL